MLIRKAHGLTPIKKRDIHEADSSHLERAKINYQELCKVYPDEFTPVNCIDDEGEMRSIEDIQFEIQTIIKKRLKQSE